MKYHYVYRITNIKENKYYYGVRTSNCSPEQDLGIKYFSSSTDKDFLSDQITNRNDYKYKIIRVFDNRDNACDFELYLHNKFDVGINDNFYNRAKSNGTGFDRVYLTKTYLDKFGVDSPLKVKSIRNKRDKTMIEKYGSVHAWHCDELIEKSKRKIQSIYGVDNIMQSEQWKETRKSSMIEKYGSVHALQNDQLKEKLIETNNERFGCDNPMQNEDIKNKSIENKAKKMIENGGCKNLRLIHIFDENGDLLYECSTGLKSFCIERNLPYKQFYKSYMNKGKKLYLHRNPYDSNLLKFKGWSAIAII